MRNPQPKTAIKDSSILQIDKVDISQKNKLRKVNDEKRKENKHNMNEFLQNTRYNKLLRFFFQNSTHLNSDHTHGGFEAATILNIFDLYVVLIECLDRKYTPNSS